MEITKAKSVTKIYDKFYELDIVVNSNEWDTVHSYFKKIMNDDDIANNFSTIVFRLARDNNLKPVQILEEIKGVNGMELSLTMSHLFNNDRSNTVLIGVSNVITPNYYAARNVIQ